MEGVTAGLGVPRWHVQHVTIWRPPKLSLLIAFTIWIIRRAMSFRGGSSSHFGLEVPAPVWQSPQHTVNAAEKRPIVPMNSSTGMPLSTWMFLKTCSAIGGLVCAKALPSHTSVPTTTSSRDENFMDTMLEHDCSQLISSRRKRDETKPTEILTIFVELLRSQDSRWSPRLVHPQS